MSEVYIVSARRSPIGRFAGSLKDVPLSDLATSVARAAITSARIDPKLIDNSVFGMVNPTEPADAYLARVAACRAGVPVEAPALTVNRLCGSGLSALIIAAQAIMLGDSSIALAGGAESMSRAPYLVPAARFGARLGDAVLMDSLTNVLHDPFHHYHMGVTAENIAERYAIDRRAQDDCAFESHRRAAHAIRAGWFEDQLVPIIHKVKGKEVVFCIDEHVRMDAVREEFDHLKPAFKREGGTVTAGNASGINDGAAAVVLASGQAVKDYGLEPMARLVSYGLAGVDPAFMGLGPVPASRQALERAGLTVADLDIIEANEAFAAQACAVARDLDFDAGKLNPNGSGIALGHPIGATGAILAVKAAWELKRTAGRYALITMCIGGGQGVAAVLARE